MKKTSLLLLLLPVALLGACASTPMMTSMVDNAALPEAVRAPAGSKQTMWTVGAGEITYECREKAAGQYEWVFVTPVATLKNAAGAVVGKYYGGPTWEANDGSKVTGKQLAVAPSTPGNIPLQLVKADPATPAANGMGAMQGVSHIQRLKTQGGVAPAAACGMTNKGERRQVAYQADYVFYSM
ncbi:DUF3455 domain-containing protein [Paucibacter sp. XJ19-41]|uniref:DUF3455 domain-containing protein n=1 Tax=Paucibacter sp. XJ19-41 TaxID=2927824 RepID=UPI00234A04E4|nr:DUF3455 domain-containing protein [Paucibacter sp. XJ19-41]MDC6169068.1 DUF3455 domain-containing protein [Paucibacter sp. XJ19-41]